MIVRTLEEAARSSRRVVSSNWESNRLALHSDNLGFSFHITRMYAGTTTSMHYKNHIEAVYCLSGKGSLFDPETGVTYPIQPGTLYILDNNDPHCVSCETDLVIACVFAPALHGQETHDADGSYPLFHADSSAKAESGARAE